MIVTMRYTRDWTCLGLFENLGAYVSLETLYWQGLQENLFNNKDDHSSALSNDINIIHTLFNTDFDKNRIDGQVREANHSVVIEVCAEEQKYQQPAIIQC